MFIYSKFLSHFFSISFNLFIMIICNYIRFPLYVFRCISHARLQIYIIRTKLQSVRSSFFQGMLKSSFFGWLFGRSPSGRAFRCKSSLCCGLSPAIPNVGERVFTVLRLNLGARAVPFRRPFPTTPAGYMAEAEHRGGRTNGTRPSVLSHRTKFIIGISLARPLLSRMNGNSYFTFAVISSIRFVIFLMEYFSINLLFAASVFNFSLINFSWGRSDWQHSFKFSISVP